MIATKEIKMNSKKMLGVLFMQYGMSWAIAAFAGFILFIILGATVNLKFYMLALIWVFLFVPLVMAFLYFFYGMNPLTAFNSILHKIYFFDDRLSVVLVSENEEEEAQSKEYTVKKTSFSQLKFGSDYILLFFNKEGWLWVPFSCFDLKDDFNKIITNFKIS